MNQKDNKIKHKLIPSITTISSLIILIFQYVPCTAIWFGIMSVPLFSYLILFFQYPSIIIYDFQFLIRTPGFFLTLIGVSLYLYSVLYQLKNRKQLLQKGPYRVIRHPQYLAFIVMTLGMTLVAFQTSPIIEFALYNSDPYVLIFLFWIGEVLAYIIIAKIEEVALANKFGAEFNNYKKYVGFMIPIIKRKR